jgi:hypothetical protein
MLVAKKVLILKSRIKIFKKVFQEKILLLYFFLFFIKAKMRQHFANSNGTKNIIIFKIILNKKIKNIVF